MKYCLRLKNLPKDEQDYNKDTYLCSRNHERCKYATETKLPNVGGMRGNILHHDLLAASDCFDNPLGNKEPQSPQIQVITKQELLAKI